MKEIPERYLFPEVTAKRHIYRPGSRLLTHTKSASTVVFDFPPSRTMRNMFLFISQLVIVGEGNGTPLQCSCLENPMGGGAWWAAVYGVAQSRT